MSGAEAALLTLGVVGAGFVVGSLLFGLMAALTYWRYTR